MSEQDQRASLRGKVAPERRAAGGDPRKTAHRFQREMPKKRTPRTAPAARTRPRASDSVGAAGKATTRACWGSTVRRRLQRPSFGTLLGSNPLPRWGGTLPPRRYSALVLSFAGRRYARNSRRFHSGCRHTRRARGLQAARPNLLCCWADAQTISGDPTPTPLERPDRCPAVGMSWLFWRFHFVHRRGRIWIAVPGITHT